MARQEVERHMVKQLQNFIMYHFDETNMTAEEFEKQTDMWPEVFTRFQHARDRGEVMDSYVVLEVWEKLELPMPNVTLDLI